MEYSLAIQRSELLIHAATEMDLEGIMMNEKKSVSKNIFCIIPFIKHSEKEKIVEMENRFVVSRG